MSDKNENNNSEITSEISSNANDKTELSTYYKMKNFIEEVGKKPAVENSLKKTLNFVDYSIDFILNEKTDYERNEVLQIARKPILFGIWVSFITFIVCGIWSMFAPINSAAMAQGIVMLNDDRKTIQHLEGGIVKKILVQNGDKVVKGQTLLMLDDTRARTSLDASLAQLRTFKANETRLIAERDDSDEISFDPIVFDQTNPEMLKLVDTQKRLFKTRKEALEGKTNSVKNRIEQQKKVIESFQSQLVSAKLQLKYNNEQLDTVQKLFDKGQGTRPKLLELQSRVAHYDGSIGEYTAKIAQANHAISEQEIEIINYKTDFLNNVIKELKETQSNIAQLDEDVKSKQDILDRVNIVAPQDGIVNDLQFHTVGGVIQPQSGQKLLEIIPQDDKLVIEASVEPKDIDIVGEGMLAMIKIAAGKSRTTPTLDGKVTFVSPETVTNRMNGASFYKARIEIDQAQFKEKNLKNLKLYPGMQAQVFIITGSRSLMRYILDPVIDSVMKSFRER